MNKSLLVRVLGFPSTLIHGDTLVLDRWLWLKKRLPKTANGESLIDIGCGTGAFTIGTSLRGYQSLGLSWDDRNQNAATERAQLCKAPTATFQVLDVRQLHTQKELINKFDVAICLETIEHIIDDQKLLKDIAMCLKPGGRLLLTTPNYFYNSITKNDDGPFETKENGWHVRRGYTPTMLTELCKEADLVCENISYCSGLLSQKTTFLLRTLSKIHFLLGWALVFPLRILPPIFDGAVTTVTHWPSYSICLEAYKPRY